jgi:hypothetical protein
MALETELRGEMKLGFQELAHKQEKSIISLETKFDAKFAQFGQEQQKMFSQFYL